MQNIKHKYIINYESRYAVMFLINIDRDCVNASFCFSKYESQEHALKAAIKWRNKMLKKYNLLERIKTERRHIFFSRNKNKHPCIGVYFTNVANNHGKYSSSYWSASYTDKDNDRDKTAHFSIDKLGSEAAFQKACRLRYKHCGKLRVVNKLPFIPRVPYIDAIEKNRR